MSNTWMGDPDPSETAWHAPRSLIDRFAVDPGGVDSAVAASFEAHLVACARCRDAVTERVGGVVLEDSWRRVASLIDTPHLSILERVMIRLGVSDSTARLLGGTPALTLATLGSVVTLAAMAVATSRITDSAGGFLVVAPLLPLLAIVAAFASVADPVGEAAVPTPMHGVGLVLRRAAVVLSAVFMVLGVADLAVGDLNAPVVAWLLPALALPVGALALGTWFRAEVAAMTLGIGWMVVVLGVRWTNGLHTDFADSTTFAPPGQVAAFVLLLGAAAVVVVRRDQFQTMEGVR
ncbi:MAG TPA: hypothetical protein VMY16_05985 [Ilumatobacteraceae bacterium]|nr:hypothetical protein [Ilumatobacteraceae bacterium]